ncbi:MAG TPA: hypothetical protein VIL72_07340 [Beijerinckiaceae bacterium]|jgi:hypothetical protein
MKIIQADDIEWKRGLEHRGGTFHYRHYFDGEPDTPGNFQFNVGRTQGNFNSPRHRHNFEQYRFQIDGAMDFARNGKMTAGAFGYFPEGAAYGPQSSEGTAITAVLQFGGASGSGYLSRAQVKAGQAALEKFGTFKDGVFRRNDDVDGRRNSDAYQAIWEHHNGRTLEYPKPRYRDPVMLDPQNYEWAALGDGVSEKLLGVFTERRTKAAMMKLDAGATWRGEERSIYLVVSGAGRVEDQRYGALTGVHAQQGERPVFVADEETVILQLQLPDLSGLRAPARDAIAAE